CGLIIKRAVFRNLHFPLMYKFISLEFSVLSPDYVQQHWKEDAFFGYQFLNGVNPMLIRRCTALPSNFPVTDDMVFPSGQCNLADELKNGNIFLCDYKLLDGLPANTINGKKQYLMAPLVLLHKTPDDNLMPIAIQLKQTPAEDNPIFFPTDSEYDWLMAKIFVRSADFTMHGLNVHLLRTHLLAEVNGENTYIITNKVLSFLQLLVPHTHQHAQRSLPSVTFSSLCIPDDIAERGLEDVPNFYYRNDGLMLWNTINSFVERIITYYYRNDTEVQQDSELQKWISDIFEHGFLSQTSTGIPQRFATIDELVKFVTMVIFTCSAQHAAVNSGQYDYGGWMPNAPPTLQRPPPTTKGTTSEATMMQTFPDVNATVQIMSVLWLLSKESSDFVPLGQYQEDHFTEDIPRMLIKCFQAELEVLNAVIKARNNGLKVPYTYMDPVKVENSIAI
uniref:Lipoxygenase domain-containing protein n=1 Tax=Monopterus albus TaxID=43700 RepID=A0A3Q3K1T9_MONAL